MTEFRAWPKIARLNREVIVTEKVDGTNACVIIEYVPDGPSPEDYWDEGTMTCLTSAQPSGWMHAGDFIVLAQSRTRLITPKDDNFGFAAWVRDNAAYLAETLGPGHHFGEWWGKGIQRGYGMDRRVFSLFNTARWEDVLDEKPNQRGLARTPIIYRGLYSGFDQDWALARLRDTGSLAAPGFMRPEGLVLYHVAANTSFKVTLERDEEPKGK